MRVSLVEPVKEIVRAAKLRDDLSFASFRYGGFSEAADADLTDAQLGRYQSARQLPTYAKRTRKQLIELIDVAQKRRAERTNTARLSQ